VPEWVGGFFSPAAGGHEGAFLDHVSLRELSRYVGKRAGQTLLSRAGLRSSKGRE
jgi:hypothetical protein